MSKKAEPEWNEKEKKMLKAMPLNEPVAIYDLAKACFRSVGTASNKRGNSWVRNSLRKPLRLKFIKQIGRGAYVKVKPENPTRSTVTRKTSKTPKTPSASGSAAA